MLGAQLFISRTKTIKNSDHTDFCRKKLKTSKYKVRHSFSTPETGPRLQSVSFRHFYLNNRVSSISRWLFSPTTFTARFISFPKEKGSQISRATGNTRAMGSLGSVSRRGSSQSWGELLGHLGFSSLRQNP